MYKNLTDYIGALERAGELARVRVPVDPQFEIAELTDRESKRPGGGRALLFENTGTAFPVLTNMMGSDRRIAMALGVERLGELTERIDALFGELTSPKPSLMDKLRMLPVLEKMSCWLPRNRGGRGACQQVVLTGEEARLSLLPVLRCWPHDGGRFVTLPLVNTVDPDSGVRNVGMYRMQILSEHTTGMHWHLHKTGERHYRRYAELGRRMPVAVCLGGDPAYTYAATAPMPDNMDEYLLAGFLRRRPVELVRCLTSDLRVPGDCDFVIEGYVDPAEPKTTEGPFGDHTGFYSLEDAYPVFHVTAVTHRRGAVYPATIVGVPPQEDAYIAKATEKIFLAPIRRAMLSEVRDLYMPVQGAAHNIAVVDIVRNYPGQALKVASSLWGAGQMMFNKYLVVADAAAEIRRVEALAALVRRLDPARDLIAAEGVLDVLDHATATSGFGGKLALDLTQAAAREEQPLQLPERFEPCGGVAAAATDFAERWRTLALFVDRRTERVDAAAFFGRNPVRGVKCAVLFDREAEGLTGAELLWLAAADSDPRRDVTVVGEVVVVDARSKRPGVEGHPARFPNVAVASSATVERVDARWAEYGLGETMASPSERYRRLLLSDKAAW